MMRVKLLGGERFDLMLQLLQAALIFASNLCTNQNPCSTSPTDEGVMEDVVYASVAATDDVQELATLLSIARWESGGWRKDIAYCFTRGDGSIAIGSWQIHPFNKQELLDTCSGDLTLQAQVALNHLRSSVSDCKRQGLTGSNLLNEYTSGSCFRGRSASRLRWGNANALRKLMVSEYESDYALLFPVNQ